MEARQLLTVNPPNILVINTDDQRPESLPYMPVLAQQLAPLATTFLNSFATTPICAPSRASLFTGLYANKNGILHTEEPWGGVENFNDASTLATWLDDAGYNTALVGKYINGYDLGTYFNSDPGNTYVPPGWDTWRAFLGASYNSPNISFDGLTRQFPGAYSTDVLSDLAVEFINSNTAADTTPFFLYYAPHNPHEPTIVANRHQGVFDDAPPWRPPAFNEADVSDKPAWLRNQRPPLSAAEIEAGDQFVKNQLESMLSVDEGLGRMLAALGDTGQLANTIIIFTSDNGISWGEHRLYDKGPAWEESIRVPLLIYDGRSPQAQTVEQMALNIDLAPTIMAYAGLTPPHAVDGQSLLSIIDDPGAPGRPDFLIEKHVGSGGKYYALRTERYVYVEYTSGERELYDLQTDPDELVSRHNDPAYASVRTTLAARLAQLKPPDQTGPLTTNVQTQVSSAGIPALTLTSSDATTGGSEVRNSEYFLGAPGNNGAGAPLRPLDGKYDSVTEEMIVEFANLSPGAYTVYVHGRDISGNWGPFVSVPLQVTPSEQGVHGEYFNNVDLTGIVETRTDASINFLNGWNAAPPGTAVTPDANYSVRWTGYVETATAGSWTFFTASNDGVRLWIDNQLLIDNWTTHAVTENSATVSLSAGWHAIRVEYFQKGGTAAISLSFQGPGQPKAVIPPAKLRLTPPPQQGTTLAIAAASARKNEGHSGSTPFTFTVARGGDASGTTVVEYAVTGSGDWPANFADFGNAFPADALVFAPGETSKTITINVAGDSESEPDEEFTVTLSGASGGAQLLTAAAIGVILNDDAQPGQPGLIGEYFNSTTLTNLATTRIDPTVNFPQDWGGAPPGTAVAPDDNYSARWSGFVEAATAGPWTFYTTSNDGVRLYIDNALVIDNWTTHAVTQNSATLNLSAGWHALRLEYFQQGGVAELTLSFQGPGQTKAIIPSSKLRTTAPDTATLSIAAASAAKAEGNADTAALTFTVTRSGNLTGATSVNWAVTGSGTSPANAADFGGVLPSGVVFFAPGETSGAITVDVSGDLQPEPDETFAVTLSNPTGGAQIATAVALGTIIDDDAPAAAVNGLLGEYFNQTNLTSLAGARIDATINFPTGWASAPPGANVTADSNYSVRWTGQVQTPEGGVWTFFTTSNDGVRLWIDNVLIIDNWTQHTVVENSGALTLAGGWHDVRLEYFQQGGAAAISLAYQGPGQSKTIIPAVRLQPPPAQLTDSMIVGGVTSNQAKVFLRVDHESAVALEYSTSAAFIDSQTTPAIVTSSANDYTAIIPISGLSPTTRYYYRAVIGGTAVADGITRSFTTFAAPGDSRDFTFALTADLQNAATFPTYTAQAYASIAAENPAFFMQLGDFDHRNPTTLAQMRLMHRQVRSVGKAAGADFAQYIAPSFPVVHIWDDHDYGVDDGNKTWAAKPAALQAFGEYYPTTDRPNPAGIWHSFDYGLAEFFMLDVRSQRDVATDPDGPDKSMLDGDNIANGQLQWLKQELLNSTATWKFIASGVAFNPTVKPYDSWGGYLRERQEIVDFINLHHITGVIFLSGDLHTGGAIDDGTHSSFPEISVPHTNLNTMQASSGITGVWSEGADSGAIPGGYATVTVTPSQVLLQTRAEDGTIKKSYTVHLPVAITAQSFADSLAGDFDDNGMVDNGDLAIFTSEAGLSSSRAWADANRDEMVTGGDFLTWQRSVGMTRTMAATPLNLNVASAAGAAQQETTVAHVGGDRAVKSVAAALSSSMPLGDKGGTQHLAPAARIYRPSVRRPTEREGAFEQALLRLSALHRESSAIVDAKAEREWDFGPQHTALDYALTGMFDRGTCDTRPR